MKFDSFILCCINTITLAAVRENLSSVKCLHTDTCTHTHIHTHMHGRRAHTHTLLDAIRFFLAFSS